jgi:hypothetical protein
MQRDISGFMIVDVTAPNEPGFLIHQGGFTSDFNKGHVWSSMEKCVSVMLDLMARGASVDLSVISLTSVQFDIVDSAVAEDTLVDSIKAKLTADELRIIRRHIRAS